MIAPLFSDSQSSMRVCRHSADTCASSCYNGYLWHGGSHRCSISIGRYSCLDNLRSSWSIPGAIEQCTSLHNPGTRASRLYAAVRPVTGATSSRLCPSCFQERTERRCTLQAASGRNVRQVWRPHYRCGAQAAGVLLRRAHPWSGTRPYSCGA